MSRQGALPGLVLHWATLGLAFGAVLFATAWQWWIRSSGGELPFFSFRYGFFFLYFVAGAVIAIAIDRAISHTHSLRVRLLASASQVLLVVVAALAMTFTLLVLADYTQVDAWISTFWRVLFLAVGLFGLFALVCVLAPEQNIRRLLTSIDYLSPSLAIIAIASLLTISMYGSLAPLWRFVQESTRFRNAAILGTTIFLVLLIFEIQSKCRAWRLRASLQDAVLLVAAILILGYLALHFATVRADFRHNHEEYYAYTPYIAPAAQVLAGAVPLVDAFSQYGLLAYFPHVVFFKLFGGNYFSAYATTYFLNFCYFAVLFFTLRRSLENRSVAYLLVVLVFFMLVWIRNPQPSHTALRFLPPLVVVLSLVHLHRDRVVSVFSAIAFTVATFWSLEALVWSSGIYAAFVIGHRMLLGESWRQYVKPSLAIVLVPLASHVLFSVLIYSWSGRWPDYWTYVEYVRDASQFLGHRVAFPKDKLLWVALFLLCFTALCHFATTVRNRARTDVDDRRKLTYVVFPAAVLLAGQVAYWIPRPYFDLIWSAIGGGLILLAWYLDRLINWLSYANPARSLLHSAAAIAAMVLFFAVLAGFSREAAYDELREARKLERTRLSFVWANLRRIWSPPDIRKTIGAQSEEAIQMIEKWLPPGKAVILVVDNQVVGKYVAMEANIYLYSGRRDRIGYTNIVQGPLGAREMTRKLVESIGEGEILFTTDRIVIPESFGLPTGIRDGDPNPNLRESNPWIAMVYEKFPLCVLETTPHGILVLRVQAAGSKCRDGTRQWQPRIWIRDWVV